MSASPLFNSFTLKNIKLNNRLVVAPMTRVSASECGIASNRMLSYYEDFARGNFALIITEGIYIDNAWSQTYAYQSGIVSFMQIAAWRKITEAVHAQQGKVIAQIQHSGALSQDNFHTEGTVSASAVEPEGTQLTFYRGKGKYPVPRELNDAEIQQIIHSFADAAANAVHDAGFDGVEIHGANGYLLDQFFTDYTNLREDKWGGDTAGRLTLILEVIKAVRTRLGAESIIGIRISQSKVNDFHHKWAHGEDDARTVFTLLAQSGIDYLHLTEYEAWQPAFESGPLSLVALAHKYAPDLTIIANGGLHEPQRAIEVLSAGADLIALGRGALANHDWPNRVKTGRPLAEFDRDILGPVADIKDSELPASC